MNTLYIQDGAQYRIASWRNGSMHGVPVRSLFDQRRNAAGVQQRQGLDIEATVIEYLATRELLLILDNCEHLLDPSARLVDRIVQHCPGVTVLSTSREALGVEGEQIFAVPPLAAEEATELFADRARRALRRNSKTALVLGATGGIGHASDA